MAMWPDNRLMDLLEIDNPLIQSPMAGANGSAMAIAVSNAGGLGSLPCAMLGMDGIRAEVGIIRQQSQNAFAMNFFCHSAEPADPARDDGWREELAPYYDELKIDLTNIPSAAQRTPFGEDQCRLVEDLKPKIVSFHFGLPEAGLVDRVKATGATIISSATTADEARWLEARGCDTIIAQGAEAGGHRGMFLTQDVTAQAGTFALVPQVVDAVSVPVIAAGGIADGRGIAAAFALGAAGVQIGTAYLFTPESLISDLHRDALRQAKDNKTAITNLFSGKPARGLINRVMREIGPMSDATPAFPTAGAALAPLKAKSETAGSADFSSLWSGQSAALGQEMDATDLTHHLLSDAKKRLATLSS
ncbi:NAD(P)H-dependent flavin oxidoreductase [Sneathiella sp.]|uniref:NAD(P)H-dependent flavin oxidoreductase n=1 Tax=Sneathiella sp. TaxID=1964365 RepID=UPI003FA6FDB7